jgi:GT2 family glycosyltransferase
MTLSIVIVSYNVCPLLKNCLETIIPQITENEEIIVVDNASSDNSCEMVELFFPTVILIKSLVNLGFSEGNNLGINHVKCNFTLLLNPDTELPQKSILSLKKALMIHGGSHILGAHLLNSDNSLQISGWKIPNGFHMLAESFFLDFIFNNLISKAKWTKNQDVNALSGAALALDSTILKKLRGLDPLLFWMEDVDLCFRSAQIDYKPLWVYDWKVIHHGGKSSTSKGIPLSNQFISRLKFYKKHKWYVSLFVGHLSAIIQISTRAFIFAIFSIISNNFKNKFDAYTFALKRYLRFVFLNDQSIF